MALKKKKQILESAGEQSPQFSKLALDRPPEFLTCAQATEIKGAMAMGVFWPSDVYKEHLQKALPKRLVKPHHWQGKTLWGFTLRDSHGNPLGIIKLTNSSTVTVAWVQEIENSTTIAKAFKSMILPKRHQRPCLLAASRTRSCRMATKSSKSSSLATGASYGPSLLAWILTTIGFPLSTLAS